MVNYPQLTVEQNAQLAGGTMHYPLVAYINRDGIPGNGRMRVMCSSTSGNWQWMAFDTVDGKLDVVTLCENGRAFNLQEAKDLARQLWGEPNWGLVIGSRDNGPVESSQ